jgi:hypothetical protein
MQPERGHLPEYGLLPQPQPGQAQQRELSQVYADLQRAKAELQRTQLEQQRALEQHHLALVEQQKTLDKLSRAQTGLQEA